MSKRAFPAFFAVATLLIATAAVAENSTQIIEYSAPNQRQYQFELKVPPGLKVDILNPTLQAPRLLTFLANGDLLIGSRSNRIYRAIAPYTTATELLRWPDTPQSVVMHNEHLFFAGTEGIYRAPYALGQSTVAPDTIEKVLVLPGGRGHDSRTLGVSPDQQLYVSLGISGNCSDEYLGEAYPPKRRRGGIAKVLVRNGAFSLETFASGLRNPIGFDWHPSTGTLYASNNGPDHLGFDQPPEYFAEVGAGSFHGMPWYQYDGKQLQRDDCAPSRPPRPLQDVAAPIATFPARNAPMGVAFVPAGALNSDFEHSAIVALHGSWATAPHGTGSGDPTTRREAKLVRVVLTAGQSAQVVDLVTGFQLANGARWLRPVGVAIGPDGALYFTSDGGINGLFRLGR